MFPSKSINRCNLNIPQNINLGDPGFCNPSEVDALIGAKLFYQLLCIGQIKLNNSALILQKTRLGWIVSGALSGGAPMPNRIACNVVVDSLNEQVSKFWELEEVPSVKHLSDGQRACEEHFSKTHTREHTGRYSVKPSF